MAKRVVLGLVLLFVAHAASAQDRLPALAPSAEVEMIEEIRQALTGRYIPPSAGQAQPNSDQAEIDRMRAHDWCRRYGFAFATNIGYARIDGPNGTRPVHVVFTCALK